MPDAEAGSADDVLAALVASLRSELAVSQAGLARALEELAQARPGTADGRRDHRTPA